MIRYSTFLFSLFVALSVNAQLNNGLIVYYPFNNGNTDNQSGTSFSTLFAQSTSATANVLGMPNQALSFGGSDPQLWVDTDDLIDFGTTTSFTFVTDFKTSSSATQNLFRDLLSSGIGWRIGFYGSTGYITFQSGAGATLVDIRTATTFNDGAWHQVALLVDKANYTVRMNVDNVPQELAGTVCGGAVTGTEVDIPFCNFNANENNTQLTTFGEDLVGAMDEIRLYGRILAPGELNAAYALSFGGPTAVMEQPEGQLLDRYDRASGQLFLSGLANGATLTVTTAEGKLVATRSMVGNSVTVGLAELGTGVFFVSVLQGGSRWTGRYVVTQ